MQKLFFEDAWERTISKKDHDQICAIFRSLQIEDGISFTYLWEAVNHRDDILVTTIIHNKTASSLSLRHIPLQYEGKDLILQGCFTVPVLIPAKHSMPWTFIFTPTNQSKKATSYYTIKTDNGQ